MRKIELKRLTYPYSSLCSYFLFRISEAWVRNPATQVNNELFLYLHFKLRADGRKITVGTNSQIMPDYMPALKENRQSS